MPTKKEPKPNTNTALTEINPDELDEVRQFTGETGMENRVSVPFIKFSGKTGAFSRQTDEKDAEGKSVYQEVGDAIAGVIIKIRKRITTKMSTEPSLYSFEFDSYNDLVDVIDSRNGQVWKTGTYRQLKNEAPNIQLNEMLYLYLPSEKKVYRMAVKGASLSPLWEYVRGVPKDDTILRYETRFGSEDDKNEAGIAYKKMTFERGGVTPEWRAIFHELKRLSVALSQRAQKKVALLEEPPKDELPVEGEEQDDQISVDSIPF